MPLVNVVHTYMYYLQRNGKFATKVGTKRDLEYHSISPTEITSI